MTKDESIKLDDLCSISLIECSGAFVRKKTAVESEGARNRIVLSWLEKEKSLERVERVMNHMHLYDQFNGLTENAYDELAVRVFSCWNEALKKIDPAFRVEKFEDYGPTLTFYKKRTV